MTYYTCSRELIIVFAIRITSLTLHTKIAQTSTYRDSFMKTVTERFIWECCDRKLWVGSDRFIGEGCDKVLNYTLKLWQRMMGRHWQRFIGASCDKVLNYTPTLWQRIMGRRGQRFIGESCDKVLNYHTPKSLKWRDIFFVYSTYIELQLIL